MAIDPLTIGAIAGGVTELGKALFGGSQRRRARRALERLEKERPKGYVPSAILELADEPVAEEFIEAQEMGDQRLTSQGIGALSQGGSRAILGGLPSLVDAERQRRVQRVGGYEQARKGALAMKGQAQERLRQEEREDWQRQVAAQAGQMGAGEQNIAGGLSGIGEAALLGSQGDWDWLKKSGESGSSLPDITGVTLPADDSFLDDPIIMDDPRLGESGVPFREVVTAEWLKANPMQMSNYYFDPATGQYRLRQ